MQTFLFVGLGNPGSQYAMTRHNIGAMVVQSFAKSLGWPFKEDRRFNACAAKGSRGIDTVHLLLPLTYMNLSGTAVRQYADYFKVPLNRLLIIADDIALPFGQLRLRGGGSAGGHNGLKSVEACLGTAQYQRLRMGVGDPGEKMLAMYVLESFCLAEQKELPAFVDRSVEVLNRLLKESFSNVMTSVNTVPRRTMPEKASEKEPTDLTKPPVTGRGE